MFVQTHQCKADKEHGAVRFTTLQHNATNLCEKENQEQHIWNQYHDVPDLDIPVNTHQFNIYNVGVLVAQDCQNDTTYILITNILPSN